MVCSGGGAQITDHSSGGNPARAGYVKFTGGGPLPTHPAIVAEPKETYDVDSIGVVKKIPTSSRISTVTTSTCSISSDGGLMFSTTS